MIRYDDYVEAKALMKEMAERCGFRTISSFVRYVNDTKKDIDEMHAILNGTLYYSNMSNDVPTSAVLETLTKKYDKLVEKGKRLSIEAKGIIALNRMSLRASDKLAEMVLNVLDGNAKVDDIIKEKNKIKTAQKHIQHIMKTKKEIVKCDIKDIDNMIKYYITHDTENDDNS